LPIGADGAGDSAAAALEQDGQGENRKREFPRVQKQPCRKPSGSDPSLQL